MKYFFLVYLVFTLSLAPSIRAQSIHQGFKSELKGVKKIFIDTGTNSKDRDQILEVLWKNAKKLSGVEVVNRPEDADVWLTYSATKRGYYDAPRESDKVDGKLPVTNLQAAVAVKPRASSFHDPAVAP